MNRLLAVALLLLVPSLAAGQEAKKFNVKQLEQDFAPLAVFQQKGKVVDNEVIVTDNRDVDHLEAVYVVRADLKKAIEFYRTKQSIEPKQEGDETLGTVKVSFSLPFGAEDKRLFKVTLCPTDKPGSVQVTLLRRAISDEERPLE